MVTFPDRHFRRGGGRLLERAVRRFDQLTAPGLVSTRAAASTTQTITLFWQETISEEPLGPVVPHGDEQWYDVVKTR